MKRRVQAHGREMEYILIRTARRDVMMRALPGGETRVYAPAQAQLKALDALVADKISQIQQMHAALEHALLENRLRHPVSEGSRICVEGQGHALHFVSGKRIALKLTEDTCILTLPHPESEEAVRAALKQALSCRALERIRAKLNHFAPRLGVSFGRVTVRDQKSRWGSCSAKGNLNFNWKLIMAPPEVLDYVVIHELCHRVEFNHSPRFWALVAGQMPEYAYWKKWLKAHGPELGLGEF